MTEPTLVSVLVRCFNEEENAEKAYQAITAVFERLPDYACEIIFTDNHSTDRTFPILRDLASRDPRVRVIRFARNYGYQRSLLVAYQSARGACSVQIDCDLQDSPEHIPQMLALWRQGHQVVYGIRRSLADPAPVAAARRLFYRGLSALSDDDLPIDAGEFRLVDARILAELRSVRDTSPYLRGMISSMGFSQVGFAYDRVARTAGHSKFPMRKMVALAMDGLLNHSLVPLRMASGVGIAVGIATILLMVGYLAGRLLFGQQWPAGFATTTILLLLGITLNAVFLGIIGEYLGRMFLEIKGRPAPIVEVQLNGAGPLSLDPEVVPLRPPSTEQRRPA